MVTNSKEIGRPNPVVGDHWTVSSNAQLCRRSGACHSRLNESEVLNERLAAARRQAWNRAHAGRLLMICASDFAA